MPLFIPKLAADARPPLGFPPIYRFESDAVSSAILLPLAVALGLICQQVGNAAPLAITLSACLSSFYYVSKVALRRCCWWHSRYSSSTQLLVAISIAAAVVLSFGTAAWARGSSDDSRRVQQIFAFAIGCFAALHLVYADGSAFLQAFGLKWVNPARYRTCSAAELLLSLVLLGSGFAIITSQVWALWTYPLAARAAVMGTAAVTAVLFLPAMLFARSHELHFHHWCGALLLLPAASAAAPYALASIGLEGLAFGLLCEAAATWGLDPWLVPRTAAPLTDGSALLPASTDFPTVRLKGGVQRHHSVQHLSLVHYFVTVKLVCALHQVYLIPRDLLPPRGSPLFLC